MQDTKAFIAAIEGNIANTESELAELERLAAEAADVEAPLTDEMRELFERLEAMDATTTSEPTQPLPLFAIRI